MILEESEFGLKNFDKKIKVTIWAAEDQAGISDGTQRGQRKVHIA